MLDPWLQFLPLGMSRGYIVHTKLALHSLEDMRLIIKSNSLVRFAKSSKSTYKYKLKKSHSRIDSLSVNLVLLRIRPSNLANMSLRSLDEGQLWRLRHLGCTQTKQHVLNGSDANDMLVDELEHSSLPSGAGSGLTRAPASFNNGIHA